MLNGNNKIRQTLFISIKICGKTEYLLIPEIEYRKGEVSDTYHFREINAFRGRPVGIIVWRFQ